MKNKRTRVTVVLSIIGILLLTVYAYHEANDDPNRVTEKWLRKNPNYWKEGLEFYEKFDYEGLDYNTSYCKLASGKWLEIRAEKGFLGTWKVVHVEEVSFEELPEWAINDLYGEDYLESLKDWKEKHRGEWKSIFYDKYSSYGYVYYAKLNSGQWLRIEAKKDTFDNWSLEEKEIGKDAEEIAESLYTWHEQGEITVAEIEKFLEILAGDGTDTDLIRTKLIEKGVSLQNDNEKE